MYADIEIIDFEQDRTYTTRCNATGLITEYKYDFHEIEEGTQVQMEANVRHHTTKTIKNLLPLGVGEAAGRRRSYQKLILNTFSFSFTTKI
ncbi:hypothetical protein [Cytobacillus oceanisediminis]|uniref:hypothetical protein n=1 Tax=Cytobacillus oceanisediminis TaxID=665099 RepID=UPI001C22CEA9|nr:hypothetical protein [Cytobacillus oceanisediminis]MBU8769404.1 hypothetical protein [Cytobacillus oceanisediminis]MCM3392725.1 hypothetical protein [Cytobacillus oceanisediminis]